MASAYNIQTSAWTGSNATTANVFLANISGNFSNEQQTQYSVQQDPVSNGITAINDEPSAPPGPIIRVLYSYKDISIWQLFYVFSRVDYILSETD